MYRYYEQTRCYKITLDDGTPIEVPGTSAVCTDLVNAYIETIDAPFKMLVDLFVIGHCNVDGIPLEDIRLSITSNRSGVIAEVDGMNISDRMVYLDQTANRPFGTSVITEYHKHIYKQESISNYFENDIIKEIGTNQKYLLGVSQTLNGGISQDEVNAGRVEGMLAVSADETSTSPKAGKFQNQNIKELVEATQFKKADVMPSWRQLKRVRDEAVKLLNEKGVGAKPIMILTEDIFKISEGLLMLMGADGTQGVISAEEIRAAIF